MRRLVSKCKSHAGQLSKVGSPQQVNWPPTLTTLDSPEVNMPNKETVPVSGPDAPLRSYGQISKRSASPGPVQGPREASLPHAQIAPCPVRRQIHLPCSHYSISILPIYLCCNFHQYHIAAITVIRNTSTGYSPHRISVAVNQIGWTCLNVQQ